MSATSSAVSADHTHSFSATTGQASTEHLANNGGGAQFGYAPQIHTHGVSGTTGGMSANHSHTISTTSGAGGTGATGASGNDATGTANPPFQTVNYIIKE